MSEPFCLVIRCSCSRIRAILFFRFAISACRFHPPFKCPISLFWLVLPAESFSVPSKLSFVCISLSLSLFFVFFLLSFFPHHLLYIVWSNTAPRVALKILVTQFSMHPMVPSFSSNITPSRLFHCVIRTRLYRNTVSVLHFVFRHQSFWLSLLFRSTACFFFYREFSPGKKNGIILCVHPIFMQT